MTLLLNSAWLRTENTLEAFQEFLDHLATLKDVFIVSQNHVIEWMKNPLVSSEYKVNVAARNAECKIQNCQLEKPSEGTRYMNSCVSCPDVFPWLNNPEGNETA